MPSIMAVADRYRKPTSCISCQVSGCVRILTCAALPARASSSAASVSGRRPGPARRCTTPPWSSSPARASTARPSRRSPPRARSRPAPSSATSPRRKTCCSVTRASAAPRSSRRWPREPPDLTPLAAIHAAMRTLACTYNEQRDVLVARAAIVQGSPGLRAYKVEHQRGWDEALVAGLERRSLRSSARLRSAPTICGCSRRCRWPRSAPRSKPGSSSPTSPTNSTSWSWSTTPSSRCRAVWRCSAVSRRGVARSRISRWRRRR